MDNLEVVESHICYGGTQGVYKHQSRVTGTDMTFAVFTPPQAAERPCPILWYLSGLTCTHANVMEKGEYRRAAAEHGLIIVCPDTSPRGEQIADDEGWQLGTGAGFYVDATEATWADNYKMYSYIIDELPNLISDKFPVNYSKQSIFGHSMGGHGALTIALKNPDRYQSCSAFAPIVNPMTAEWSRTAFQAYLGTDENSWRAYDACALIEDGYRFKEFLIDQGTADQFLDNGLRPWLFEEACQKSGIPLTLRMQDGYDHSYYFMSSFMEDHVAWHAERLA